MLRCILVEIWLAHKDTHVSVRKHAHHSVTKQDVAWVNHTWSGVLLDLTRRFLYACVQTSVHLVRVYDDTFRNNANNLVHDMRNSNSLAHLDYSMQGDRQLTKRAQNTRHCRLTAATFRWWLPPECNFFGQEVWPMTIHFTTTIISTVETKWQNLVGIYV